MWSFKRKQQEVKDYYQATAGQNKAMIWLLSAVTFIGTVIIVLVLFWGGRWMYHKLADSTKDQQPPVVTTPSVQSPQPDQPAPTPAPSAPSTTPAPTPTPAPAATPSTGPAASELVRTGPSSDE